MSCGRGTAGAALFVAFAALVGGGWLAEPSWAASVELGAVTVKETDGVARRDWPLTFGFPVAAGSLREPTALGIVDERGSPLPLQARVLSRWPDGTVRWLLVDTQVGFRAREEHRLHLRSGKTKGPDGRLRLRDAPQEVSIDTGAIRFTIPKTRFAVIDRLAVAGGGERVAGPFTAELSVGSENGSARPPSRVTILEQGPLRARVELIGTYGNGFDYAIRIEVYAGQPFVRVLHTFINRNPASVVELRRMTLDLAVPPARRPSYAFGVEGKRARSGRLEKDGLHLLQLDNLSYQAAGEENGGRLAGWVEAGGGSQRVGLAARWFWQEYPKGFRIESRGLTYELWPAEAAPARAGVGAAKTHEFVVWGVPADGLDAALRGALANPMVVQLDPSGVVATGALPQAVALAGAAEKFVRDVVAGARRYLRRNERERWDDRGEVRCRSLGGERPRTGAFGMWNWGDWNFPGYHDTVKGCDAWGNLEYDTTQVLALAFAASREAFLHEAMVASARHFMDVDVVHFFARRPEWVGMNHPKNPLHFSFELGGVDLGHTWTEGLLSYYYLSGDERGLEAARGIADYLVGRIRGSVRGNPRQWGWPQIALVAVYEATGDPVYLEAARSYAKGGMAAHPPQGIERWKLGILADGLAYTHAFTADERIAEWLRRYADAVVDRKVTLDARLFPAVAYEAVRRGDRRLEAAARARAKKLEMGSWGKPFSINGRTGFRIYSLIDADPGRSPLRTPSTGDDAGEEGSGRDASPTPARETGPELQLTTLRLR